MPEVDNDGVRISYRDEGEGRPVLLLHGHTFDGRVFDDLVPQLREAGLRMIRPDLRGHGSSDRPETGYHPSHHAGDMRRVLDDAGVSRTDVVGYSVGGAVALELILAAPEMVGRLVLLSPVLPDRPFEDAFMDSLRQVARTVREAGVRKAMLGPWLESPLFASSLRTPGVREKVERIVVDFPGAEYLATERDRVDRTWSVPERLGEIEAPALVVVGSDEMAGFRGYADEIAREISDSRLEVLEGRGHLHLLEVPDDVGTLICDHLA